MMVSYSAINSIPIAILSGILTGYLKNEKNFDGFLYSDYNEVTRIIANNWPTSNVTVNYTQSVCILVNAGIDFMLLQYFNDFIPALKNCVLSKVVT